MSSIGPMALEQVGHGGSFASSSPSFYPPLQPGQIRVLRILPASSLDDDIECELRPVQRNDEGSPYCCLSYTWGDPLRTKPIRVNGQEFHATENLVEALRHLRANTHPKYHPNDFIWIDAISINQKDDEEKSIQVQMMRETYAAAEQVVIWLGTATAGSTLALQVIRDMLNKSPSFEDNPRVVRLADWPIPAEELIRFYHDFERHESDPLLPEAIRDLFGRPWWRRVWVIQEIAVSKLTWVLCGPEALGFHYISHFFGYWHNITTLPFHLKHSTWHFKALGLANTMRNVQLFDMPWMRRSTKLLEALEIVLVERRFGATDPRDFIYALLGLRKDPDPLNIKVNYSISWEHVYQEVTRAMLAQEGLKVLSYCVDTPSRQNTLLPSWAPDWTEPIFPYPLGLSSSESLYSVSGDSAVMGAFTKAAGRITIHGFEVAKIVEIGDSLPLSMDGRIGEPSHNENLQLVDWIQSILLLLSRTTKYSGVSSAIILARIAAADVYQGVDTSMKRLKDDGLQSAAYFFEYLFSYHFNPTQSSSPPQMKAAALGYKSMMRNASSRRRPFLSSDQRVGLAPETAVVGDVVCVFYGGHVPFVLRPEPNGSYRLLGHAYVHGIMDGELMEGDQPPESKAFDLC